MPKVGDGYPMQPTGLLTLHTHHTSLLALKAASNVGSTSARLAQSVERKALNLVVVCSSPTVGDAWCVMPLGTCNGGRAHPDLNQGPADLQSAALTTELCTHVVMHSLEASRCGLKFRKQCPR